MLIAALVLAAAQAVAPSPGAVALGERLARAGTLAALLPMMVAKDTDELVAAHPELSAAEQAELLTEAELRALVAQAESPAARRLRAVQPRVIAAVMEAMAGVDFKKDALAAFCARTGRVCPK